MQSEIAQAIAAEIKAIITPEEKHLIKKAPTTSLTAYDSFQRVREEHWKFWSNTNNREALERAEGLYHYALENDSTFAQAYTGLAWVYWNKHYWETFFSEDFLDSDLILANIALSYDDQLAEAYTVKGYYYTQFGKRDKAIKEYDKAIKLNPNDWMAYSRKGRLYFIDDFVKTFDNYHKAASLNHAPELPYLLRNHSRAYNSTGFMGKSKYYNQEALKLDGDSLAYYYVLTISEYYFGNYAKAVAIGKKGYAIEFNPYPHSNVVRTQLHVPWSI